MVMAMVAEAIKDAGEAEILESLLVVPTPVDTTYGNLVLIHLSAGTRQPMIAIVSHLTTLTPIP